MTETLIMYINLPYQFVFCVYTIVIKHFMHSRDDELINNLTAAARKPRVILSEIVIL